MLEPIDGCWVFCQVYRMLDLDQRAKLSIVVLQVEASTSHDVSLDKSMDPAYTDILHIQICIRAAAQADLVSLKGIAMGVVVEVEDV